MKTPILLLHGALGSKSQFEQLDQLLSKNTRVLRLNFEGHGDRPSASDFSIPRFAHNVLDFLEEIEINKVNIFGYSMGGYVALYLARHHSEKVNLIYTLGTKIEWTPEIATKETAMLNPDKIEEKVPRFAQRLNELHPNGWKQVVRKTADMMTNLGAGQKLSEDDFKQISNVVIVGLGDQDNMVTELEANSVSQLLRSGTLKIHQNTPHPIEKVDQKTLALLLNAFFSK